MYTFGIPTKDSQSRFAQSARRNNAELRVVQDLHCPQSVLVDEYVDGQRLNKYQTLSQLNAGVKLPRIKATVALGVESSRFLKQSFAGRKIKPMRPYFLQSKLTVI